MNPLKHLFDFFFDSNYIGVIVGCNYKPVYNISSIVKVSEGFKRNKNITISFKTSSWIKFMYPYDFKIDIINSNKFPNRVFVVLK